MFRSKKGQAAMEFLMTYGWAILVVLAAVAALAYFGVLSPDRFMPEKCTLPSGTACLDFSASTTSAQIVIQNAAGFDMDQVNISLTGDMEASCEPNSTTLTNGQKNTFTCTPNSGTFQTGKNQASVVVEYQNRQSLLSHSQTGELILKID